MTGTGRPVRPLLMVLSGALALLVPTTARARKPAKRGYEGPAATEPPAKPPGGVEVHPPAASSPPPSASPPRGAPPATIGVRPVRGAPGAIPPPIETPTPPENPRASLPAPVEKPAPPPEDLDAGDDGEFEFEVVDLTEDDAALAEELKVESKSVTGARGAVSGRVKDATSGEPLIGAYVEAIGTQYRTKTDSTGDYTLELPPGTYELRVRSDASEPRRISGVQIADGSRETLNSELRPLRGAGQTVVVQAEMNRESEGARLLQRKQSVGTRDLMSRDEISKSGGGSTSAVARRIVGATLVGGRYIFVRGLGHRYGNTLFDRARVPSPEPELRTVPLDIFPSSALSAINVQKTFTPDVPGDFAGGSVQLESREVPDKFLLEVGAELGANTATSFRQTLTNGSFPGHDAFGFGNIPRGLPGAIPTDKPATRLLLDDNFQPYYTPQQVERFGDAMYTDTRIRRAAMAPPNFGFKAALGYGFAPEPGSKLGFLAAASYKNSYQTLRQTIRQYAVAAGQLTDEPQLDYKGTVATYTVSWSTIGLVQYDIDEHNRLSLLGFYAREADDETRELRGIARPVAGIDPVINTRLRYIMRSILLTRLGGRHTLPKARNLTIDWFGSYAQARRDDPAMRDMFFTDAGGDGTYQFDLGNEAGKQLFLSLVDNTESGSLDLTLPFSQWSQLAAKVKVGGWVEGKQRQFTVRRFSFNVVNDLAGSVLPGTGNIINDASIGGGVPSGQGGRAPFFIQENTRPTDNYNANQRIYATYGSFELPFVRWFKAAGGARFEHSVINVEPYDLFGETGVGAMPGSLDQNARLVDNDILPSLSLIFSPSAKHNIRLVGSRTLARPEFRELAPFTFTDFVGGVDVQGNTNLTSTKLWNADLRWEWFPSASEVVAASVFYKYFDEPIERVKLPRVPQLASFRNADAANNVGVELEVRKNLEFLSSRFKDFSLGGNFAYIYSRVKLRDRCDPSTMECDVDTLADVSTSRVRPLQDQSPFVANTYLDYNNANSGTGIRVLYNLEGRRIFEVGGLGLPDVYYAARHDLGVVVNQRIYKGLELGFSAENVMNWPVRWTQAGRTVQEYRKGASFSLGLTYQF